VVNLEEFERAGLYEASMLNAGDRLALLRLLEAEGATIDEMRAALADDRLIGLAVDAVVRPGGERMTFGQMAGRAGLDEATAASLLRATGLAQPNPTDLVFTDGDVRCFRFLALIAPEAAGGAVARVAGVAMSSLAEAELAGLRASFEGPLRAAGTSEYEQAQSFRAMASLLPEVLHVLDVLHRRHLLAGMRTRVLWDAGRPNIDAAIGFADIVEYTTQTRAVDTAELADLVTRFESTTRDVIVDGGGRIVKWIGDEVMFQTSTAAAGCRIATGLLQAFDADGSLPALRIGLAFGRVLAFEGDCYGQPVNEAARLVKVALPGCALVNSAVLERVDGSVVFEPQGVQRLKGIGPVETFQLVTA
jgi:class 3 adenylate cyclase